MAYHTQLKNLLSDESKLDNYLLQNVKSVKDFIRTYRPRWYNISKKYDVSHEKVLAYHDVAAAFDIETTNTYYKGEKTSFMYVWQMAFDEEFIMGHTWSELNMLLEFLTDKYEGAIIPIYVHNLSFEFQFIKSLFEWDDVFATDERNPIRARTTRGVEFRDSYILSGFSLANLHKELLTPIHKKVGDLDYDLTRHSQTPLTNEETLYCLYDVLIPMRYIQEKLDSGETMAKIPMTKTGFVRRYLRQECRTAKYKDIISKLRLGSFEYKKLRMTYCGGFTHSNPLHTGDIIDQPVQSMDFTSSYPAVLVCEKYPMSSAKWVELTPEQRKDNGALEVMDNLTEKGYAYMLQIKFEGLKAKITQDYYLSESKCESYIDSDGVRKHYIKGGVTSNGRVFCADELITNITDVDFEVIRKAYTWKHMEIAELAFYKYGYLPTELVKSILHFYYGKTALKNVSGKEVEYGVLKGMLNAIYGAMCQDPLQDETIFTDSGEWLSIHPDVDEAIDKYNDSKSRVLFYPWGVWCCAYARRNLWTAIEQLGNDYIYADTDSVKYLFPDSHDAIFEDYNQNLIIKMETAMEYHGFKRDAYAPRTKDGVAKPLGVWDFDGRYDKFKTLGAKRYMVEEKGKLKTTIAGLSKVAGRDYISTQMDPWEFFDDEMFIPKEYTGKLTHTYIDDERKGKVTDYLGVECNFSERSGVHLEPVSFDLSMSRAFLDFILGVKEVCQ